jgi:hypothetical protein
VTVTPLWVRTHAHVAPSLRSDRPARGDLSHARAHVCTKRGGAGRLLPQALGLCAEIAWVDGLAA